MPIKPRYMQTAKAQRTVALDASTLSYLDQLAPDNISEALRYCVQFAMQHPEALFRATVQHTATQCRKHQQRYTSNAAPLPTTYAGQVMTARPAPVEPTPEPIQPAAVEPSFHLYGTPGHPMPEWLVDAKQRQQQRQPAQSAEATPGTLADYLQHADDEDDTPAQVAPEPLVIRGQPLSAAALAAVAAVALTDEEIRALDPGRGGAQPFVG